MIGITCLASVQSPAAREIYSRKVGDGPAFSILTDANVHQSDPTDQGSHTPHLSHSGPARSLRDADETSHQQLVFRLYTLISSRFKFRLSSPRLPSERPTVGPMGAISFEVVVIFDIRRGVKSNGNTASHSRNVERKGIRPHLSGSNVGS